MPRSLTLLADAAGSTGMGHWVRSTALADELAERGWTIRVVHRADAVERAVADALSRGWHTDTAAWNPHSLRTLPDWDSHTTIVLDSYRADADSIGALRSVSGAVVVIDDLADRGPLNADLVVNQNLGATHTRYVAPHHTDILLGPQFALLRPQFAHARPLGVERVRSSVTVREVLVMMGGTDATGVLPYAVQACLTGLPNAHIRAVAPLGAEQTLEHLDATRLTILPPTPQIASEMVRADLVVSAGGTSVWELCATARPFGVVVVADNQIEATDLLERIGASRIVGTRPLNVDDTAARLAKMAGNADALGLQARRAAHIVDGLGCSRVADRIERICSTRHRESIRKAGP